MKKSRKLLICRAYKAGLSIEQIAWVFYLSKEQVNKIIREMI